MTDTEKIQSIKAEIEKVTAMLDVEKDVDKGIELLKVYGNLRLRLQNAERSQRKSNKEPLNTPVVHRQPMGNRYRGGYK